MTEWAGHRRGSPEYRRLLVALFAAGVATFAQLYSPQAVLPQISRDFEVSAATSALAVSAATIGLAITVIPWSAVADRIGRVRAMVIAVSGATVFGLLVPLAPTFSLLLAGRVLEGVMLGGIPAIAIAYLNEELEPSGAIRVAGTYIAGNTIGGLAGRLISGPIGEIWGWRAGVLTVGIVCAAAAIIFITLAPKARGFAPWRRKENPDGSLVQRLLVNFRSPRLLTLFAQGLLLTGGFVAIYNFLGFRLAAPPFSVPAWLVSLIFIAYLAGTWSSAQGGALAARYGRGPILLASIAIMIVGTLLTLSDLLPVVLVGLVIASTGFFGAHAIAAGWAGHVSVVGRAQASSLYTFFFYVGASLFGWLGGVFFVAFGWGGTVAMIVTLAAIAAVLAGIAQRLERQALRG